MEMPDHEASPEESCRLQSSTVTRESLLVSQLEEAVGLAYLRLWSPDGSTDASDAELRAIGPGICSAGF